MRMNAAETSASSAIADWTPLTVVSRSRTTDEMETFISDVSTTSTNIAIASRMASREVPDASSGMVEPACSVTSSTLAPQVRDGKPARKHRAGEARTSRTDGRPPLPEASPAASVIDEAMTPATASLRVVPDPPVRTLVTPPSGIVRRPGLVRGLAAADASLVALIAPAGYGKTTLLREWAATESRPHAWITLTAAHDDPAILSRLLGEPVREPPFVLFLDRLDAVSDRRALELIAGIVAGLPPGSIVATASRAEPRLGLGGLRAAGRLVELRRDELRMSAHEAKVLLRRAGLR